MYRLAGQVDKLGEKTIRNAEKLRCEVTRVSGQCLWLAGNCEDIIQYYRLTGQRAVVGWPASSNTSFQSVTFSFAALQLDAQPAGTSCALCVCVHSVRPTRLSTHETRKGHMNERWPLEKKTQAAKLILNGRLSPNFELIAYLFGFKDMKQPPQPRQRLYLPRPPQLGHIIIILKFMCERSIIKKNYSKIKKLQF